MSKQKPEEQIRSEQEDEELKDLDVSGKEAEEVKGGSSPMDPLINTAGRN